MSRRITLGCLALIFTLLSFSTPALAELNWSIAQREPQDIKTFVERVIAAEENAPGAEDAPAVVLYRQIFADMKIGGMEICRNWIIRIKDPSALVERVVHPYTDSSGQFVSMGAFRYRDGKLRQLFGRELKTKDPVPPKRGQALFEWVDIQPGDVIGVSIITSYDELISVAHMPAVTAVPVVRSNLRIRADGSNTYTILANRGEDYGFTMTVDGHTNDQPSEWTASMNYLPGFSDLPLSPPYSPDVPSFTVIHVATYTTLPGISKGWLSTLGWRQVALRLAQLEEAAATFGVEVQAQAQEIAGSLGSDVAKEQAVFEYVQKQVETLEGYSYDPRSMRPPSQVLADMGGTRWEKLLLMQAMLQQVGVEGQLAGVRTEEWGPLDESMPSYQNFQQVALRYGDEESRWYVPDVEDAPAGKLPVDWGTCITLTPKAGLMQEAFEFNMMAQRKIVAKANEDVTEVTPDAIQAKVDEALENEGWYRWETVSPR